ncbi:DUF262 domain-containing protein [Syntrophaceticus schinkii]|uniref:GmrSD restriction endonucleases N-terminal domain-containing protein n=1 Tax=Syntrophaceticus schinkii TaxID=499207 RepID=A0A0B7MEP2_9FIRM|nr:DUF262 domain-containing protein [Syntrophaceticus schinkii]CEO88540.1 conserved hypothetical protein [Syntrophaceticus schinkii]
MPTIFHSTSEMLKSLLDSVKDGRMQLPDFQRGWVWDDERIKKLLVSILKSYPIGSVMLLETGNINDKIKPRLVEGVNLNDPPEPQRLILDGQQRITSLYQALYLDEPVKTRNDRGKEIKRWYYLDMGIATDPDADKDDAIISVPENKIITGKGGVVIADYSTIEKECEAGVLPVHYLFSADKLLKWQNQYFSTDMQDRSLNWSRFMSDAYSAFNNYQLPVITLLNTTPKEAVCQVFENVNTGGMTLNVFELLTASFAADNYSLRDDWRLRYEGLSNEEEPQEEPQGFKNNPILSVLDNTDFLQTIALLVTYNRKKGRSGAAVSCKRRDILNLDVNEYREWNIKVTEGFYEAAKFLMEQKIFSKRDIPYPTQLIPLTAILVELGANAHNQSVREKISRWYWCGVFGELYGAAIETRFAKDLPQVISWLNGGDEPDTVSEAAFDPNRLLTLRTRNSAAYKGVHVLLMKEGCRDFMSGVSVDLQTYYNENIDIHHIFPQAYCRKNNIPRDLYNSIINKTPLSSKTNRSIGGNAPSVYLNYLKEEQNIHTETLDEILGTHLIDVDAMRNNNFDVFFEKRKEALYRKILKAMG